MAKNAGTVYMKLDLEKKKRFSIEMRKILTSDLHKPMLQEMYSLKMLDFITDDKLMIDGLCDFIQKIKDILSCPIWKIVCKIENFRE